MQQEGTEFACADAVSSDINHTIASSVLKACDAPMFTKFPLGRAFAWGRF